MNEPSMPDDTIPNLPRYVVTGDAGVAQSSVEPTTAANHSPCSAHR